MRLARGQSGFTLLEVMIAFALLTVVLSAVFITQGTSLSGSTRNKNILIATNLARNFINETEVKCEGLPFDRLPAAEESGNFKEPYQQYKWKLKFTEVEFTALADLMKKATEKESDPGDQSATVLKIFGDYMKKSVRRMTVTIEWPEGSGTTTQSFNELLVNYDTELTTGL
jgi:prepilin-type N-terminal cleavage/methylation domain-containing protein